MFYAVLTAAAFLPTVTIRLPLLALWPQFACGLAVHAALASGRPNSQRLLATLYLLLLGGWWFHVGGVTQAFAPLTAWLFLLTLAWEHRLPAPPRFLTAIGVASYSIYLIHVPFMSPFLNLARRLFDPVGAKFACLWILQLFLGVLAGLVFHHVIERRCEALRARLIPR
ncbi:MAG: hypothetical protein IT582_04685 [Opitutaceae bacterium]|nr:hypothetical protein [Opitutaceae bacterium]